MMPPPAGRFAVLLAAAAVAVSVLAVPAARAGCSDTGTCRPPVTRAAGSDRIETAILLSRETFAPELDAVVVASAETFADALAATSLAAAVGGPVLLNPAAGLDPRVGGEIERLGAGTVFLLGGEAAQSAGVEASLRRLDGVSDVARVAGPDRYATAAAAAREAVAAWRAAGDGDAGTAAIVALGDHPVDETRAFPDAIASGPWSGHAHRPILLVHPGTVPAATRQALADLGTRRATVVGGTAAIPEARAQELRAEGIGVDRIGGATRYETATGLADAALAAGATPTALTVATGQDFPDALGAGAAAVARDGVLVLLPRGDLDQAPAVRRWLLDRRGRVGGVLAAGGTAALQPWIGGQLQWALGGFDPPSSRLTPVFSTGTPLGVVTAPGVGDLVFTREGTVHGLDDGRLLLDLRDRTRTDGERGLLGLAAHPRFADDGRLFVHYSRASDGATVLAEVRDLDRGSLRPLLVLAQPASNHNGGTVAFGPDGMLHVFLGDGGGGGDRFGTGQAVTDDPDTGYDEARLGSVLRLDVSTPGRAAPAAGNPFLGRTGDDLVWAHGLRNPFRASFDRVTRTLWIGDVGQGSWEEIDAVPAGQPGHNFGWSITEGDHCFGGGGCDRSGLTPPVHEYATHQDGTCSVIGGHVYRGTVGMLRGHYFYGDLCAGFVRSFRLLDGATEEHRTWPLGLDAVFSFGEGRDGSLYVSDGDTLFRLDVG